MHPNLVHFPDTISADSVGIPRIHGKLVPDFDIDPQKMDENSSQNVLGQYLAGDDRAAVRIHDRYVARLLALARTHLTPRLAARFDPEDVVQSAYRSFFVRARDGKFELARAGDLWRLLAQIALNKLRSQVEWHSAQQRDPRREQAVESDSPMLAREEPTPAEVLESIETLERLMRGLSAQERVVLERRLQGESNEVIAKAIGRTERTVRRILERIAARIAAQLSQPNLSAAARARSKLANSEIESIANGDLVSWRDFVLEQHLGTGGMGRVYRARQKNIGRMVALKALRKDRQTDPEAVQRFLREVELVRRLNHPGIVPVFGLGRFPAGGWFLVQELVVGDTFESWVRRQSRSEGEVARLVAEVSRALEHAHSRGVLHCDLTPQNVLVEQNGAARVVDFGLGKLLRTGGEAESGFTPAGTLSYMAPEQLDSDWGTVDATTDVYGLGGLLYFGLTGGPPRQVVHRRELPPVLADTIEPPPELMNPHNVELWKICRRCLESRQTRRFSEAREVADRLERFAESFAAR